MGQIFDSFFIKVDIYIDPPSPIRLHQGGQVRLQLKKEIDDYSAKWETNDTHIISVERNTGIVVGRSPGNAKVVLNGVVKYLSKIEVYAINVSALS